MKSLIIPTVMLATVLVSSCSDDEIAKPKITVHEIGEENSKTGTVGEDLHIDIDIIAEGKVDEIQVTIHPEGEHDDETAESEDHEWEVDTTYTTTYSGKIDPTFHEHIDIPEDAELGEYHFHFVVTDQEGNVASVEEDIQIVATE